MKKMIVLRHGDADPKADELSELGIQQMMALAPRILSVINGGTIQVISSPKFRAIQSAGLIRDIVFPGSNIRTYESLRPNDLANPDEVVGLFTHLMREFADVDNLIAATHNPWAYSIPMCVAEDFPNGEWGFGKNKLTQGQAAVLDFEARAITIV